MFSNIKKISGPGNWKYAHQRSGAVYVYNVAELYNRLAEANGESGPPATEKGHFQAKKLTVEPKLAEQKETLSGREAAIDAWRANLLPEKNAMNDLLIKGYN